MNIEFHLPLLLDLLLKSAALLALAGLFYRICRRASAANRHVIAFAALVALLLLPLTKLVQPRWAYELKHEAPAAPLTIKLPPITTKTSPETKPDSSAVQPAVAPARVAIARVNWSTVGVATWLAGFLVVLMHRAGVGLQLRRLARHSCPVNAGRVLTMARELAAASGVRAELRESDACRVPLAFGVWRPTVLLPTAAMNWSDERLSAALLHEFGHIRRRDCITRLLADLVCALYWLNPLVWFAARQMRLAQEQACDDLVLNAGARPDDYATQLVDVVRSLQGDRFTARHALAMAQPSTLETRVLAIVDGTRDRSPRSLRGALAGFAFATIALTLCAAAQLRAADEKKAGPAVDVPAPFGPQVEIAAKFIEITGDDPALLDFLKAFNPTPIPVITGIIPSEKADAALKGLAKAKGVDLLSSPRVTTKSKQRAIIEIIREFRYPTEWEKDAKTGAWTPKAFESKNVGVTFDVTPEVHAGNSIDLKMTPEVVEFEGFVDLDGDVSKVVGKPDAAKPVAERAIVKPPVAAVPEGHRAQPVFHTRKMSTELTVWPGQTIVLGGFEAGEAKPGGKEPQRRLVVFVTARILDPKAAPVAEPKADGTGKVEVRSDEITFDKKTGTLSASGNVKIETAQATITAAAAEITPKKSVPAEAVQSGPQSGSDAMFLREWKVPPGLLPAGVAGVSGKSAAQDFLEKNGIVFGQGAVAAIEPKRGNLVVRNTQAQLDLIEAYIAERVKSGKTPAIAPPRPAGDAKPEEGWIFPKIDFRDASVRECVDFLVAKSKTLDPNGVGANIVLRNADKFDGDAKITLSLSDVPFAEVLHYVAALGNCDLVRAEFAFVMQPAGTAKAAAPNVLEEKNAAKPPGNPAPQKEAGAAIRKADAIIFPKIDLRDATLAEAVEFLRAKAKSLDADGKGVNLVLQPRPDGAQVRITLNLTNVPLSEALRYVASLAGYEVVADEVAITLRPAGK